MPIGKKSAPTTATQSTVANPRTSSRMRGFEAILYLSYLNTRTCRMFDVNWRRSGPSVKHLIALANLHQVPSRQDICNASICFHAADAHLSDEFAVAADHQNAIFAQRLFLSNFQHHKIPPWIDNKNFSLHWR